MGKTKRMLALGGALWLAIAAGTADAAAAADAGTALEGGAAGVMGAGMTGDTGSISSGDAGKASTLDSGAMNGSAIALSDVQDSYAASEIQALVKAGVVNGYEDGTFRPHEAMTREAFAVLLAKALQLPGASAAAERFDDVADWAKPYVGALVQAQLSDGVSDRQFGAEQPVTREQLAVFFLRAMGLGGDADALKLNPQFTDTASIQPYAVSSVALAEHLGFLNGMDNPDGTLRFEPGGQAERQAVARLAYELYAHKDKYVSNAARYMDLLHTIQKADTAVQSAASYRLTVNADVQGTQTGKAETLFEVSRQPLLVHLKQTLSGIDPASDQPIQQATDAYIDGGTLYSLGADGKWTHTPYTGDLSSLEQRTGAGTSVTQDRLLIPFLTVTNDSPTTQTFSCVLSGHDYMATLGHSAVTANPLQKATIRYTIDTSTGWLTAAQMIFVYTNGDIQETHSTLTVNDVKLAVPAEALK